MRLARSAISQLLLAGLFPALFRVSPQKDITKNIHVILCLTAACKPNPDCLRMRVCMHALLQKNYVGMYTSSR